jgi:ribokinase
MKIFNYGSINIDHIYRIPRFVKPGETLASQHYQMMLGGKGANQSIALARAGASVQHIGRVSSFDDWIFRKLQADNIGVYCTKRVEEPTGHAIIQVNDSGENAIMLFGGANQSASTTCLAECLSNAERGDWLLLQNECNLTNEAMKLAKDHDMTVVFNPAPMPSDISNIPIEHVDYLIMNEVEGLQFAANEALSKDRPKELIEYLHQKYPHLKIILTLGKRGVVYKDADTLVTQAAETVEAVDTTAAGDTFIGYFVQQRLAGESIETALSVSCKAAAVTVQTLGASDSIPTAQQLIDQGVISA